LVAGLGTPGCFVDTKLASERVEQPLSSGATATFLFTIVVPARNPIEMFMDGPAALEAFAEFETPAEIENPEITGSIVQILDDETEVELSPGRAVEQCCGGHGVNVSFGESFRFPFRWITVPALEDCAWFEECAERIEMRVTRQDDGGPEGVVKAGAALQGNVSQREIVFELEVVE
jgi:hypothetical protein